VQLAIDREGTILDITVVREKYHVPSVFTDSLDESTLLITLTGFSLTGDFLIGGGTSDELGVALLENEWAENIILDLRSNGGGYLFLGVECASWFMAPDVELLHMTGREFSEKTGEFFTLDTVFHSIQMRNTFQKNCVILADSLTASTSEAFITMMKEAFPEMPLIGTTTYGKGVGQVILTGPDSGLAKITSVQLEAMSGETWNGIGIAPDIKVEAGEDAIDIALGLLNGTLSKRRERTFRVPVTERKGRVDFCVVDRR
jgi:carboxyl-terminal processing protease